MTKWLQVLLIGSQLCSSLFLSGCWDRTEINDIAIVMATSYDKVDDGKFSVAVQLPLPGQMGGATGGGGGTSRTKSYYVDSEIGKTIREANDKLQARMSRKLFFSHRRVLVIGEDLAREVGIREVFDVVARVPENRLTAQLIIAKGKGFELLNAQPKFERYSGEVMRELVVSDPVINARIKEVALQLSQVGSDALVPYMDVVPSKADKSAKDEIELIGYAQFRDDKMISTIKGDMANGMRWLKPKFRAYSTTFEIPDQGIASINIYRGKSKIKSILHPDYVEFAVKIDASGFVLETMSPIDLARTKNVLSVQKELGNQIKASIEKAVEEIKDKQSDTASLGLLIAREHPRQWQEKYEKDWDNQLAQSKFTINVKADVTRVGLTTENIAKRENRK